MQAVPFDTRHDVHVKVGHCLGRRTADAGNDVAGIQSDVIRVHACVVHDPRQDVRPLESVMHVNTRNHEAMAWDYWAERCNNHRVPAAPPHLPTRVWASDLTEHAAVLDVAIHQFQCIPHRLLERVGQWQAILPGLLVLVADALRIRWCTEHDLARVVVIPPLVVGREARHRRHVAGDPVQDDACQVAAALLPVGLMVVLAPLAVTRFGNEDHAVIAERHEVIDGFGTPRLHVHVARRWASQEDRLVEPLRRLLERVHHSALRTPAVATRVIEHRPLRFRSFPGDRALRRQHWSSEATSRASILRNTVEALHLGMHPMRIFRQRLRQLPHLPSTG
jgi:hypothetical protein